MANQVTAFLERLTGASGDYNKAKVGTLSALDAVYLDVRAEIARMGQTIRLYFPDIGAFTDQVANDWQPDDLNPGYIDIPFAQRPGKAIKIHDFEQFQTATDIITQYLDPIYKRGLEYANGQVFAIATTGNFPTTTPFGATGGVYASYPAIATTFGEIQYGDLALAWNLLVNNKVPITGPTDASLLYHPDLHKNTLTDTNWYQENLVGAVLAQSTRQQVAGPGTPANVAFNFNRRFDQQAVTAQTANLTGTVTVANGTSAVTGSSTTFTTSAPAGSWITFGTDTIAYPVKTVTDDTHIVLGQLYAGALTSGATFTRRTYTSVAMHRYAMALAIRPLELVNNGAIQSRIVMLNGIPIRIMVSYVHAKASWMLTADYCMVAKVIRPDFGVILTS